MDDPILQEFWKIAQNHTWKDAFFRYKAALKRGIAKEVARKLLPEGLTETHMFMCCTVRDWFHYLQVRMGPETQKEHRELAMELFDLCYSVAPATFGRLKQ